jgi:hypothetical protein
VRRVLLPCVRLDIAHVGGELTGGMSAVVKTDAPVRPTRMSTPLTPEQGRWAVVISVRWPAIAHQEVRSEFRPFGGTTPGAEHRTHSVAFLGLRQGGAWPYGKIGGRTLKARVPPRSAGRTCIFGSLRAVLISSLSLPPSQRAPLGRKRHSAASISRSSTGVSAS